MRDTSLWLTSVESATTAVFRTNVATLTSAERGLSSVEPQERHFGAVAAARNPSSLTTTELQRVPTKHEARATQVLEGVDDDN